MQILGLTSRSGTTVTYCRSLITGLKLKQHHQRLSNSEDLSAVGPKYLVYAGSCHSKLQTSWTSPGLVALCCSRTLNYLYSVFL